MPKAELEVVTYNKPEIINTATRLIYTFANYSNLRGAEAWPLVLFSLVRTIKNELPNPMVWEAQGVTAFFSGIPEVSQENHESRVVFSAPSPHFVLEENMAVRLPRPLRKHVGNVIDAISREMEDAYRLDVVKNGTNRTLWFPKKEYAKRIDRFEVPMITPQR
jgi:hypothetical protein